VSVSKSEPVSHTQKIGNMCYCKTPYRAFKHLGLWDLKVRPPPKVKAPSVTIPIDDSDSQVPFSAPSFYPDPDYPMDSYVS
jgi:hypothetical protein